VLPTEAETGRLEQLEEEVVVLKEELAQLRQDFLAFKRQFD
jgi:ribosomal protein L29